MRGKRRDLSSLYGVICVYVVVGLLAWLLAVQVSWATVPVCVWAISVPVAFCIFWAYLREVPSLVIDYVVILFWPATVLILLVTGCIGWFSRQNPNDYD
jgi:hypothetical protein